VPKSNHFISTEYIKKKISEKRIKKPVSGTKSEQKIGIILGTGLGGLVKDININFEIDYNDIPNFPVSTVESHKGKLIFGTLSGKDIIAMQGRFHFYEGYSHSRIIYPVKVLNDLGIKYLIVSNACGALNPQFKKSDLMIITSHINLHFTNPLIGNVFNSTSRSGKTDSAYYSRRLINLAERIAQENEIEIRKGVYATVHGPNLETRSEYRFIKNMGADVVGMSTVPEVIVAHSLGMECLGLSIVTDEGFPDSLEVAVLENILKAAAVAEPKLTLIIKKIIENL